MLLSFLASLERQEQAASPCQPHLGPGLAPRRKPRKRRPIYKVAPLTVSAARRTALIPLDASALITAPAEPGTRQESEKKQDTCSSSSHPISSEGSVLPPQNNPGTVNNTHSPLLNQLKEPQLLEVICTLVYINTRVPSFMIWQYFTLYLTETILIIMNLMFQMLASILTQQHNMQLKDNRNYR